MLGYVLWPALSQVRKEDWAIRNQALCLAFCEDAGGDANQQCKGLERPGGTSEDHDHQEGLEGVEVPNEGSLGLHGGSTTRVRHPTLRFPV